MQVTTMNHTHPPIRLLIVDDEEIIRYGINAALQCESSIEVLGEASNGQEAIAQVEFLKPDIVLMDINMPLMNGVTATEKIYQAHPDVKVLILTTSTNNSHLHNAMQKGASGYLLKDTPPQDFIHIIQGTYKGYMQFSPLMGQKLHQRHTPTTLEENNSWQTLTPREQEISKLIAEGSNNREIAQRLYITEKTVRNHVSNILNRVELRDRTQLAIWVNRLHASGHS